MIKVPDLFEGNKKISARFRNINIVLFIVVTVVMFFAISMLLKNITRNISRDYALLHSVKTVSTLNTHINREIGLMAMAVRSRAILDWFADENNSEKKAAAHKEMRSFIDVLYSDNLYFGVNSSLKEYSIDSSSSLAEFKPYATLDPQRFDDRWYFECADFDGDYVLNVDIDKLQQRKRVWLNCKVTDNGALLGVLSTGLQFDRLVEDLFKEYDSTNVRSLVIDGNGIIQMDSDMLGNNEFLIYDGARSMDKYSSDPFFLASINAHISSIDGYFGAVTPTVIALSSGRYSYATIAPIEATNWSVVTFFDPSSLYDMTELYPLLAVILAVFVAYTIVSDVASSRYIFVPFNLLMQSLARAEENKHERIFGANRNDEFGELSKKIQGMKDRLDSYNTDLENEVEARSAHLQSVYKRIAENEQRLSRVFDNIHVALATFECDLTLSHCNNFCLELFNVENIEQMRRVIQMDLQQLTCDHSISLKALFEKARDEKYAVSEVEMHSLEGTPFWVELTIEWVVDPAKPANCGFECYIINIQGKKETEYALIAKANTDKLTGLNNRAFLDSLLPSLMSQADRSGYAISLVMLDIDHFKAVNDTYGHDVGDTTLKALAQLLAGNTRKSDVLARWGGEEFVLLMPDTNAEGADVLAEKLRKQIESELFPQVGRITASFGVAQRKYGEAYESWFKRADSALLKAKESGRNRIVISTPCPDVHFESNFDAVR